jgi:hypothetical protein
VCRIAHKDPVGIAFSIVARRSHVVVAAQHGVDGNNTQDHIDEGCLAFCTVSISFLSFYSSLHALNYRRL